MAGKEEEGGAKAEKGGGNKKLLLIIAAVVLLLGGGGAGAFFMFAGGSGSEKKPEPIPSGVVAAEAITVNLADGHYLKIAVALQMTTEAAEAVDASKALDIVISEFSNLEVAELSANKERETLKKELTEKIVKAYTEEGKEPVMAVYFTEFVIQ